MTRASDDWTLLPELLELGMVPVVAAVVVAEVEEAENEGDHVSSSSTAGNENGFRGLSHLPLVEVEADEVVEVVEFVLAETEVEVVMVVALDEVAELVAELLLVDEAEEELLEEEPVPVREKATLQLVSSAVGPSATVKAYWPEGTSLGTVTVNEVPETPALMACVLASTTRQSSEWCGTYRPGPRSSSCHWAGCRS